MELTEQEKNELIDEVLDRLNGMSEEETKLRTANNIRILKDLGPYYTKKCQKFVEDYPYDGKGSHIDGPHTYQAYLRLRQLIPWIIGVRYGNIDCWNAFYENNPGAKRRTIKVSVANDLLEEDEDLATIIGKELIDLMFKYLEPEAFDEKEAGKSRNKSKRSPFKEIRRL